MSSLYFIPLIVSLQTTLLDSLYRDEAHKTVTESQVGKNLIALLATARSCYESMKSITREYNISEGLE